MPRTTVQRVSVHAAMKWDPTVELATARERAKRGDGSWQEWLEDYGRGTAAIVALTFDVELLIAGAERVVRFRAAPAWLGRTAHPPELERQLQEIAEVGLAGVGATLRAAGVESAVAEAVRDMYVHVELGRPLAAWLLTCDESRGRALSRSA